MSDQNHQLSPDALNSVSATGTTRVDGREKVTGKAKYGSDFAPRGFVWAFLKTSPIAKGTITSIDESEARAIQTVLDILTYQNVGEQIKPGKMFKDNGYMGSTIAPLRNSNVMHFGQIVAVAIAETFEGAREAANRLKISYKEETPAACLDAAGLSTTAAHPEGAPPSEGDDPKIGDFKSAFANAAVKIDAHYETPTQHHNPIELFTTVASWEGAKLTIWESSQNVWGLKNGLAEQLGIPADDVHVISPFVGGAFGSRGSITQRTALIALGARRVRRPVKLVATRDQGFTIATYRAETRHHVQLGADRDGKLVALSHEGWEVTSRPDDYNVSGTQASTRLYGCPNIASKVWMVHADRNTPGFMRSPPETPYLFALESAMDELAYELDIDPIQLRLRNDTQREPIKGLPYTSRHLRECYEAAAQAFGWAQRPPSPRSMREGDWLIGWGTAATMYPTQIAPAAVRIRLTPQGKARVETATHEIGNGVRTAIAITASAALGLPIEQIEVDTGDTRLPPAPVTGGSNSTASVCNAIVNACNRLLQRVSSAAVADSSGIFAGVDPTGLKFRNGSLVGPGDRRESLHQAVSRVGHGAVEVYVENVPAGAKAEAAAALYKGNVKLTGGATLKDRIQFAFGAHCVEVRVHCRTGEVRAPRAVGAFAFGRVVNPLAARSQLMGGQIWGISAALHEATEIDRLRGGYYNQDLAEYLIPVNADIIDVETIMLPEIDHRVNNLGIKGVGELGNVGMNAAIANAVYHATGVRIRKLPIRLDHLIVNT